MKKYLFLVFLIIRCVHIYGQQISNAGMENWQSFTLFQAPDSFYTFDNAFYLGTPTTEPTTDAHSGQYAALIQTIPSPGASNNSFSGAVNYGSLQTSGAGNNSYGWPFTGRPIKMKVWYKYLPAGIDSALFGILLQKNNGSQIDIGAGLLYVSGSTPVYTEAEIPITYSSGLNPDTIILGFIGSAGDSITPGTLLYIDDITLEYSVAIADETKSEPTTVFPNPFTSNLYIQNNDHEIQDIQLKDISGRLITEIRNSIGSTSIDGTSLTKGIYLLSLKSAAGFKVYKVVKE